MICSTDYVRVVAGLLSTTHVFRYRCAFAAPEIQLTAREYTLLEALARNEGRLLSREYVQERVWNDDESYSNTTAVRIRQLRQKVDEGHPVRLIHTVYGQGYVLRAPESE